MLSIVWVGIGRYKQCNRTVAAISRAQGVCYIEGLYISA
jgi:hypothetical protein